MLMVAPQEYVNIYSTCRHTKVSVRGKLKPWRYSVTAALGCRRLNREDLGTNSVTMPRLPSAGTVTPVEIITRTDRWRVVVGGGCSPPRV